MMRSSGFLRNGKRSLMQEQVIFLEAKKKRLDVLRALLKESDVIIFDESTASIDIERRKRLFEILNKIKHDKIIIFITHNIEECAYCDHIYSVKNRKVQPIEFSNLAGSLLIRNRRHDNYVRSERSCEVLWDRKNQNKVLRGVNFTIHKGEFVAVMGPSGSGKTTLLDCISRYKSFESGEVLLNGKDLGKLNDKEMAKVRNEKVGFVFQDFMLLDGLTVYENVCIPQVIKGENYKLMEKKTASLLKMFDIDKIGKKYPAEISGGQKQRTAVARALINDPLMILADEPTGNLDSRSSEAVIDAFITAKQKLEATILMVTHDSLSASYCDRVILMRDGVVCAEMVNKGDRREFFNELMDVLRKLNGGE